MEEVRSYLDFGYQKGKEKIPYDSKFDQDAYDFFMVSRYTRDIIGYRTGNMSIVHHKEDLQDNIKKYTALNACKRQGKQLIFYEIGSSLMGAIDGIEYINRKLKGLNVKDILFVGVDNSWMMNHTAQYLHESYKLALFSKKVHVECDLFFAKGVSILYSCDNEEEFCDIIKRSKIAVFDYTFSKKDAIHDFIGSGKPVTFLSLEKCKKLLAGQDKVLVFDSSDRVAQKDPNRATYEVIYGDKEVVARYQEELKDNLKFQPY